VPRIGSSIAPCRVCTSNQLRALIGISSDEQRRRARRVRALQVIQSTCAMPRSDCARARDFDLQHNGTLTRDDEGDDMLDLQRLNEARR
jgi:hypothetical protein